MSTSPKKAASRFDGPMQVIGGKITMLRKADGVVNLLGGDQMQAGTAAGWLAVGGQAGPAANAVAVALYEGEDVEHFGFALSDHVVTGTFERATFSEGDEVKVVASQLDGGVMFAHAVVRVSDGMLWMPYNINRGRRGLAKSTARMGMWGGGATFFLVVAMALLQGWGWAGVKLLAYLFFGLVAMVTFVGYWVYRDSVHEALYAEKIFKVLGFKNPRSVDLSPFSLAKENNYSASREHYVFRLRNALAAYGSLSKAQTPAAKPASQGTANSIRKPPPPTTNP